MHARIVDALVGNGGPLEGSVAGHSGSFPGKGRNSIRVADSSAALRVLHFEDIVGVLLVLSFPVSDLIVGDSVLQSHQAVLVGIEVADIALALVDGPDGLTEVGPEGSVRVLLVPQILVLDRLDLRNLNGRGKLHPRSFPLPQGGGRIVPPSLHNHSSVAAAGREWGGEY